MLLEYSTCKGVAAQATLTYSDRKLPKTKKKDLPHFICLYSDPEDADEKGVGASTLLKSKTYYGFDDFKINQFDRYSKAIRDWWKQESYNQLREQVVSNQKRLGRDHMQAGGEIQEATLNKQKLRGEPSHLIPIGAGAPTLVEDHIPDFCRAMKYHLARAYEKKAIALGDRAQGELEEELVFSWAGEYGSASGRPPWHIAIFPRKNPLGLTAEQFSELLLGTQDDPGPLQKAWKYADWKKLPEDSFRRKCEPFNSGTAAYFCKYIMKKAKGLRASQAFGFTPAQKKRNPKLRDFMHLRADGSLPEFVRSTKPKTKGRGVGYLEIEPILEKSLDAMEIFLTMTDTQIDLVRNNIYRVNTDGGENTYFEDVEYSNAFAKEGINHEMAMACIDVYRLFAEWWTFEAGGKRTSIRPPAYWREMFYQRSGIDREELKQIKEHYQLVVEAHEARKSEEQKQREADDAKAKADRWKEGAVRYSMEETHAEA
jgi:hypothetical protein